MTFTDLKDTMTPEERLRAAIRREKVDRLPYSMWYHMPHVDQDPPSLAEEEVALAERYGYDFIKLTPFGHFQSADYGLSCTYHCTPTQPVKARVRSIREIGEWGEIHALPGCFGNQGKVLMAAQMTLKLLKERGMDLPVLQTVFSPLTVAFKLAGARVFDDFRKEPQLVAHALEEMTVTTIRFVEENISAGVSGFFFASQCSTYDYLTEEEYRVFGEPYDRRILEAAGKGTFFNAVHIHGENTMFDLLASYPVQCVNWHDRWVSPSLAEARTRTDKCLMGGINERWVYEAAPGDIEEHVREAVRMTEGRGFILTPGCTARPDTPPENLEAFARAARTVSV